MTKAQAYEPDAQLIVPNTLAETSYWRRAMPKAGCGLDAAIAGVISLTLICVFTAIDTNALGLYLIPTFCCSLLFGKDMVALFRQKMDLFDPKGIVGCLGYVNTFVAPMMLLTFGTNDGQFADMQWGVWIGLLGVVTLVSSLLYMWAQRLGFSGSSKAALTCFVPKYSAVVILVCLAGVSLICWAIYYFGSGGYQAIAQNRDEGGGMIRGMGPLMVIGEAAPWFIFAAVTLARGTGNLNRSAALGAYALLGALFLCQIILGGLKGSRSQLIGAALAIIVQIHFFWSPVRRRHIIIGLIPLVLFSYVFAYYKDFGSEIFALFQGRGSLSYFEGKSQRAGIVGETLTPMSMSDIQSFILRSVTDRKSEYSLRLGRTYAEDAIGMIPGWMIMDRKPWRWSKMNAGCEMAGVVYDPGKRYNPGAAYRIYGLAGEAMLNFGVVGPLFMFPIWGFAIGRMRRYLSALPQRDMRLMIMPLVGFILSMGIVYDLDNVLVATVWSVLPCFLVMRLISFKVPQVTT